MQYAGAILLFVVCLAPNIFPHYLTNGTIFERMLLKIICGAFWFLLRLLSEAFFILRRTERDVTKNVYRSAAACKVPVMIIRF